MENSTGAVNPINCDNGSPLKHCIDLVTMLAGKGLRFSMSAKIENSFVFQLESKDAATAPKANKRSPSYKRRQEKRKLLSLEATYTQTSVATVGGQPLNRIKSIHMDFSTLSKRQMDM